MNSFIKTFFCRILFRFRLVLMDIDHYLFGPCLSPFPPSFYYLHTEEEIDQIHNKLFTELDELLQTHRNQISKS